MDSTHSLAAPARHVNVHASAQGIRDGFAVASSRQRMVVAIAMIDLVGFSSHIERDAEATLRRWHLMQTSCIEPAIKRFQGTLFRRLGDGLLVHFRSVREALECMMEIQRGFTNQPHDPPILDLRSGINWGEAVILDGDLQGDAVNVACRLQELAGPGGILISAVAAEEMAGGQISEPMEDAGDLELKGIARRVRAYSLLKQPAFSFQAGKPSIAVLPFTSDAPDGGYFGDGIVDDIVNALAALPDLFVVSRSSTLAFRGGAADLRKVRHELGVRYVLSGTVRRAADQIQVTTQLSDSESILLWSEKMNARLDDIFDLQDRWSQQIVATIAPHLREAEIRRVARKRPENLNAYDCFLRGLDLVYRLERERFDGAKPEFERAIALDPKYAAPYAYSALWHAVRIGQGWSPDVAADRQACQKFADKAVELDRRDATSLALCGHVHAIQFRNFERARALFGLAIATSPNSAIAWTRSSPTFSYEGDWKEARFRALRGMRLSPLDRHVFYTCTVLTLAAYTGGDYAEAIDWGYKAMGENPEYTANLRLLCAALAADGRGEEARQVAGRLLAAEPGFRVAGFCARYAYKDPERRELLATHLRAGGLPD